MMFEARVSTVEAMEPTVYVEALASRCMVKAGFSLLWDAPSSSNSSTQFSCSYCCLRVLIQNLHTRYVAIATTARPPMTPPAMAPTFGPLWDEDLVTGIVAVSSTTQDVDGHV